MFSISGGGGGDGLLGGGGGGDGGEYGLLALLCIGTIFIPAAFNALLNVRACALLGETALLADAAALIADAAALLADAAERCLRRRCDFDSGGILFLYYIKICRHHKKDISTEKVNPIFQDMKTPSFEIG